jgi:18S rRNA (guanine1575-N7)-methyltransferase
MGRRGCRAQYAWYVPSLVSYDADVIEVALEREVEGDLFLHDIGQGFGFRPGAFDGAIRSAAMA